MLVCPHCKSEIRIQELPHQGYFNSYRICPNCDGKFTVDKDTKIRQAFFIFFALISLVFTILLYFYGTKWLTIAIISYVILVAVIYWGNKQVFYVPYDE
jgi:CXXC-20-CXXC protein